MTPEERAAMVEVPWCRDRTMRGPCAVLDDAELRRRIAAAIEAAVAEERERCKGIYRNIHSGGCRMVSLGHACMCFLCRVDYWDREKGDAKPTNTTTARGVPGA